MNKGVTVILSVVWANLKDPKTTGLGLALALAAAISLGWISEAQIQQFMSNLDGALISVAALYMLLAKGAK